MRSNRIILLLLLALLAGGFLLASGSGSGRSRVTIQAAADSPTSTTEPDVQVQICPPLCGEPTTTTAPPAPATTTQPPAPAPAPQEVAPPDPAPAPLAAPAASQPGMPSQAWWDAIEQCESGGINGWRTGYFGIEAQGTNVGDLSYADQLAWAQRIFASAGPSAWGCWATVGGPY